MHFIAVRQQARGHGCGRHRHRTTQNQPGAPVQSAEHEQHHQRRDRADYLRCAQTKHGAAHGVEFGEVEFHTQREHQENHAEFSQVGALLGAANQA